MYGGGEGVDAIAHDKISDEYKNTLIVEEYYKNQLYDFMLNKAESFGIEVTDEDGDVREATTKKKSYHFD